MNHHVIVGSGPIGTALTARLTADGHEVTVVTRSGGESRDGVRHLALDAGDADALSTVAAGAAVLYNAANPRDYHRWAEIWPPLAASLLTTAERTGAVLATVGNLYGYGPVDGPISEDLPQAATFTGGRVRAGMSADAFAAHEAGRVRSVEVRASDYLGGGAYAHANLAARAALAGRTAMVVGDPDQPHTWTGTDDTARTLVAVATDERHHGRAWHVPSNEPRPLRRVVADVAERAGVPVPRILGVPAWAIRSAGLGNGQMRAMADVMYQHTRPYVLDDSDARRELGLAPTPWTDLLDDVVATERSRAAA
ncbi:NAD-dependent epimerase/dehydratase family protein [Nocardioides aestuarii]|uniref:NAD-dependent epimerase/dehydratase family protein n=1 Tax=Nocardioides aestuarii TaxID=252231 RepID=A0ABW4TNN4_9ACTN